MKDVLQLVKEAVGNTNLDIIKNPSIYVIINMLAQVDRSTMSASLNSIEEAFASSSDQI